MFRQLIHNFVTPTTIRNIYSVHHYYNIEQPLAVDVLVGDIT